MTNRTRPFTFDPDVLEPVAQEVAGEFAGARPFPHVVVDGIVPDEVLLEVAGEFPDPAADGWREFNRTTSQRKFQNSRDWTMGPASAHLLGQLNSGTFCSFLERVTGIAGLVPDPHFEGGGMHQITRGGFLKIHADFNIHPRLRLDRRLNVLLYLNDDWDDEWGGQLELWERDMSRCAKRVSPGLGTCVVFATTDTSFHGHPDPLECPDGFTRKSLALYYYTAGRPEHERSVEHSTLYQTRPGERFAPRPSPARRIAHRLRKLRRE